MSAHEEQSLPRAIECFPCQRRADIDRRVRRDRDTQQGRNYQEGARHRPNENKMSDGWPAAAGKLCGAWLRFHPS